MFFFNFFLLIAVIIINHKKADLRYRLFPFLPFKSVYISGLRPWLILSTLAVYHFIKLGTIFKDGFIRCCYRALSLWWSSPPYICPVHSWPSDPFLGRQKHQEARWIHGNHPPLPYEKVVLFFFCSFISFVLLFRKKAHDLDLHSLTAEFSDTWIHSCWARPSLLFVSEVAENAPYCES